MKSNTKRHIQNQYRKQLKEKKTLERDFVITLILMLLIGGLVVYCTYWGGE